MFAFRSAAAIVAAATFAAFGATPLKEPTHLARASTPTLQGVTLSSPPATCPITPPPSELFVPPHPYPAKLPARSSFWLGSEKLWTMRYKDGLWRGYWVTDPDSGLKHEVYADKVFWWRKGYDWRTENPSQLKVTWKRLDGDAPSLYTDRANAANIKIPAMVTVIDIPTVGCLELTGDYKGDKLKFVVWVVPAPA
jgi:hypothetical protein